MDPITHALSGAIIVKTLPDAVRPRWMFLWGAIVTACPDLDLLLVRTPLDYIVLHRTVTHSFVGAVPVALLFGLLFLMVIDVERRRSSTRWTQTQDALPGDGKFRFRLWKRAPAKTAHATHTYDQAQYGWTLLQSSGLAYLLLLHHLWLDCVTSYGTQIFWPFSDYRVRLSGLFIVSPLLVLPLVLGLVWKRQSRRAMAALLVWTLAYPAAGVATREILQKHIASELPASVQGLPVLATHLSPDAFTPFHWKAILDSGSAWQVAGYTVTLGLPENWAHVLKPPQPLWDDLARENPWFRIYENFVQFPALVRQSELPGGGRQYVFADLRFGSTIGWVDDIQARADDGDRLFEISARLNGAGRLAAVRLLTMTGAGGDSGWVPIP